MITVLPAIYIHDAPLQGGMRVSLLLDRSAIRGPSELRLLPNDPTDPVTLLRLDVSRYIQLDGEVPLWRLGAFVTSNVQPTSEVRAEFAVHKPMGHALSMHWMLRMYTEAEQEGGVPYASARMGWPRGAPRVPTTRYEATTHADLVAALRELAETDDERARTETQIRVALSRAREVG